MSEHDETEHEGAHDEDERDEDEGWGAVSGEESIESDETLTEEERGEPPQAPDYVPPTDRPPSR